MKNLYCIFFLASTLFVLSSCTVDDDVTPTKSAMEGVWIMTESFDTAGNSLNSKLAKPVVAFHLSSDNTVISTAGPMFMYVVYGDNKYTSIASTIDQVFNYAGLDFNGAEFFVGGGEQDRFTFEMKLEGLPGQKALTTLLDLIGVTQDKWDVVIYHKFRDVKVTFDNDYNKMTWTFDHVTNAVYNTKDNYGDYILWEGWPVNKFAKGTFVFEKQTKDLQTVVSDAI